jgi:REP element-mobilizing transposase RayT
MNPANRFDGRNDYLKRLPPGYYRGQAYIHWSMTMEGRKTGWLVPDFHSAFREVLTHTTFRYGLCCPIYCLMPDHMHLLWVGVADGCDQRTGLRYLRRHLNPLLEVRGARFQQQPYDHVLREEERERAAFESVVEYIALNPERAGLVGEGRHRDYPYTSCLVPGYPELRLWQSDYWERFWRVYSYMREHGMTVAGESGGSE